MTTEKDVPEEVKQEKPQQEQQEKKTLTFPAAGVDFGKAIGDTTGIWKSNMNSLVLISLVFLLVCWIPIANFVFFAGYLRALLKTVRGEKAEIADIFKAWDCFAQIFIYAAIAIVLGFILGLIPLLGSLLTLALSVVVMPGLFMVVDQEMNAFDAYKWSFGALKADLGNWILVVIVGGLIASVGAIAFVIGLIFTLPFGYLLMVQQYEKQKNLTF